MAARENLLFTADAAAELHLCPSAAVSPLDGSAATFKTYTVAVGNVHKPLKRQGAFFRIGLCSAGLFWCAKSDQVPPQVPRPAPCM